MVTATKSNSTHGGKVVPMWQPSSEKGYLKSIIMKAYKMGLEDGYKQSMDVVEKALAESVWDKLEHAMNLSTKVLKIAKDKLGMDVVDLYLKAENPQNFCAVYIFPEKVYYSEKKKEFHLEVISVEKESNKVDFSILFSTMPAKKTLDTNKLIADGYQFRYVENQPKAEA